MPNQQYYEQNGKHLQAPCVIKVTTDSSGYGFVTSLEFDQPVSVEKLAAILANVNDLIREHRRAARLEEAEPNKGISTASTVDVELSTENETPE